MKNRLLAVAVAVAVAILLLVVLGLPYVMGLMTESRVRADVAAIDANAALSAAVQDYERGWFSSRARIEIGLDLGYLAQLEPTAPFAWLDAGAEPLPVVVEFSHGPVEVGSGFRLGMASVVAHPDPESERVQAWQTQLGMPYLFEFRGRAGFGGGLDFDADVPPIDYVDGGASLVFTGLVVEGTATGRHIEANSRMDRLEYLNSLAAATIETLELAADYDFESGRIALGHSSIQIERVAVASDLLGPDPVFESRGLGVRSDSSLDSAGEQLELAVAYSADTISAGPAFAVSDATFGMTLGHLDSGAANEYYEILRRNAGAIPGDPAAALEELESAVQQVLAGQPTLSLMPIEFSMDGEPFAGTALLATDASRLPAAGAYDLDDAALWMQVLTLDADATVSKALARRFAAVAIKTQLAAAGEDLPPAQLDAIAQAQAGLLLAALSGQGYLTDVGESYATNVAYRNGALTVNGSRVPLVFP